MQELAAWGIYMGNYKLGEAEMKFAEIIWEREPLTSSELVKVCESKMNWKKSTTYTVLKKMCEKGYIENKQATVSVRIPREKVQADESNYFVERTFDGSLPGFLTAFLGGKTISEKEAERIKNMIDSYTEK